MLTRQEELSLIDPAAYRRHGYPWDAWRKLRESSPLHFVDAPGGDSYWAVTRHQDIVDIQTNPEVFRNAPRMIMSEPAGESPIRMVVNMDPPEHHDYRMLAERRFMPRAVQALRSDIDQIVTETLDAAMAHNGEVVDLQRALANPVPTSVICGFLGAPRELWPRLVEWTDEVINASDPDIARGRPSDVVRAQAAEAMFDAYRGIVADRRGTPRDDLMTDLVNARFAGAPMPDRELYSWCYILTTAGHETTQSTFGAGILALIQHPDQLAKLRTDPGLVPRAVDEVLRYVSPAIHFCRTPIRDVMMHGMKIPAGQPMVMFYPSANRDERVFDRPEVLDIERFPNRHLAFGVGPHQCLGMHLARLELRVMFEHFLRRVEAVEIAGPLENVYSCVTGGYRRIPVRMQIRPG